MILGFDEFILYEEEQPAGPPVPHEPIKGDPEAPWFIILLGGSGTGKGALVSTNRALGEIGDYIEGKTFSSGALKKAVDGGKKHIRSVFEPDRILRLTQYDAGVADYKKIIATDPEKDLQETLDGVFGENLNDLKNYIVKKCGGRHAKVKDFTDLYKENQEPLDSAKYHNSYVGKKYKPADVEEEIESVDILDALEDTKRSEGDKDVMFFYQQMRKRSTDVSKGEPLKDYSVNLANSLVQKHLENFKQVFGEAKVQSGSVILDSAGEDLASQPVKAQLSTAKAAGFNTLIILLCTGPVQSFIGHAERKIARANRGVPSDEIMSFYKILPVKHEEFRQYGKRDKTLDYQLLDGYKILNQEQITPEKLLDVIGSLCIGTSQHGPASKDKAVCTDPQGDCVSADLYPDYLSPELRNIVKKVNKHTKNLKKSKEASPAKDWTEIFTDDDRKKELAVVHDKIKNARAATNDKDKPLQVIDGFSPEAEKMFIDWKDTVAINKKAEMKTESKVLNFEGYIALTEGFGEEPFFLAKNGDDYSYFFKVETSKKRGFVLSINKSATVAKPSEKSDEFAVLHLTEIPEDELEQAVVEEGKYKKNTNTISANDADLVNILSSIADCVSDYLDQNAGVTKFYDEMPTTLRAQRYDEKMEVAFDKWPGDWNMQEQEPGKLNIISK